MHVLVNRRLALSACAAATACTQVLTSCRLRLPKEGTVRRDAHTDEELQSHKLSVLTLPTTSGWRTVADYRSKTQRDSRIAAKHNAVRNNHIFSGFVLFCRRPVHLTRAEKPSTMRKQRFKAGTMDNKRLLRSCHVWLPYRVYDSSFPYSLSSLALNNSPRLQQE